MQRGGGQVRPSNTAHRHKTSKPIIYNIPATSPSTDGFRPAIPPSTTTYNAPPATETRRNIPCLHYLRLQRNNGVKKKEIQKENVELEGPEGKNRKKETTIH
ncbi:hypothetical protein CHS0354_033702 [Potamilus streckersoni]|uniref:Uncharacterized protein n=1 Tax=Potamilus streckersoni TaxID=2493646 RepID=A0AAE0S274_9BIVA|nr:hypothetical protein CHS0354_033702 [Potamilus streckersoni]